MSGLNPRLLIAGDFIMLRMALVDALDGDIEAALVLQRIAWRCERDGFWKASHEDIQQETRLSERKVKGALKVLRDRGFLTGTRSSAYDATLVWSVQIETDETSVSEGDETSVSPSSKTGETPTTATPPLPVMEGNTQSFALQLAPAPVESGTDPFDTFWEAYPKKVDKGAARRAWKAASKKAPPATIIAGAKRYAAERRDKDRQYTKNPATWLNAEAWGNETQAAVRPRDISALWIKQDFGNPLEGIAQP